CVFHAAATTAIYTLSLHDALPISGLIGSEHLTLDCDPRPAEDLVKLIRQLGLPFGDSSLLPTYWVSKAAGKVVKVALSGDGGDEDRKSTRLNSSHDQISYAVFCLK